MASAKSGAARRAAQLHLEHGNRGSTTPADPAPPLQTKNPTSASELVRQPSLRVLISPRVSQATNLLEWASQALTAGWELDKSPHQPNKRAG